MVRDRVVDTALVDPFDGSAVFDVNDVRSEVMTLVGLHTHRHRRLRIAEFVITVAVVIVVVILIV